MSNNTLAVQTRILETVRRTHFMNLTGLINHTGLAETEIRAAIARLREKGLIKTRELPGHQLQVEVR